MNVPERFDAADAAADAILRRLDGRVRLALPLGLGKAVQVANAVYRRARADAGVELDIFTALTLERPQPRSPLEARFLGPVVERLYGDVPELDYAGDRRRGCLPNNVRVHEFYFRPGGLLGNQEAQRRYVSSNYSHAARDLAARKINVIGQMVAPEAIAATSPGERYSLSCNPDLTDDLLDAVAAAGGPRPLLVGEVNPELPYLVGDAVHPAADFDVLIEGPSVQYGLFPVPNQPVTLIDHAIGIRTATLILDGGTLQLGIGSLGDAVCSALLARRVDNTGFRRLVAALDADGCDAALDDLPEGLYGMSEMFVEGFLRLREHGILTRTAADGDYLHAGFFLGSAAFYRALAALGPEERAGIGMSRISFTNRLGIGAGEKLHARRRARFVNTTMMMTLLGAAVSDALEDGRVVSGVGGQHDFVVMAHELPDGRSILALPATRTVQGKTVSNIVWNYGHVTIPRHLRDLVVTEYGVADLRGADDEEVIRRLLNLADSRFQQSLRRQAVEAGKLSAGYRIPGRYRNNRRERLQNVLTESGAAGLLPHYPLGTDFTPVEAELAVALAALGRKQGDWRALLREAASGWPRGNEAALRPALQRLGLDRPRRFRERLYRALVASALYRQTAADDKGARRPMTMEGSSTPEVVEHRKR